MASVEDGVLALRARDFKAAATNLLPEADKGHAFAQETMGDLYASGLGVDKDMTKACAWWERAAMQGRGQALHNLGLCYALGQGGLDISTEKAVVFFEKAAAAGVPQAWCSIGELHLIEGTEMFDPPKGIELCRKAAELGAPKAQFTLGGLYLSGSYVEKDFAKAASWMKRAAEQGEATAQYTLGLMYRDGHGQEKDLDEAGRWLESAASRGHTLSQFNLGELLFITAVDPQAQTFNAARMVGGYYWLLVAKNRLRGDAYIKRADEILAVMEENLPEAMKAKVREGIKAELGPDFSFTAVKP